MPALLIRYAPHLIVGFFVAAALYGSYRHGVTTTDTAWQARHNAELATAHKATADAQAKARDIERKSAEQIAIIEGQLHEQEQRARAEADRLLAGVESGAVRVRDRFTCPASGVPSAGARASGDRPTQAGGLQQADVITLVRIARDADAVTRQLTACQAILHADRAVGMSVDKSSSAP